MLTTLLANISVGMKNLKTTTFKTKMPQTR